MRGLGYIVGKRVAVFGWGQSTPLFSQSPISQSENSTISPSAAISRVSALLDDFRAEKE